MGGVAFVYSLALVLPEALTRAVQVLSGAAILFHLREMMIGRPARWPWLLEATFLASCLIGGWGMILAIRSVYA
ncbi:hypothetical protein [Caulobacter sp. BP25]|uniref:hypothetical protein n=1 Tax=Caulobacter sp. BP25 TaxID=2048900 RepID=UPI000C12C855|nr:hypothetical protein [Caulobacter sp. BP25]PHY19383.1 hypothetical protein CSW59_13460 [Caulobacter sp. BP25]